MKWNILDCYVRISIPQGIYFGNISEGILMNFAKEFVIKILGKLFVAIHRGIFSSINSEISQCKILQNQSF